MLASGTMFRASQPVGEVLAAIKAHIQLLAAILRNGLGMGPISQSNMADLYLLIFAV